MLFSTSYLLFFASCGNSHKYDKSVKELDSLKVVVQQSVSHFKEVDSLACYNVYNKQYTYAGFIKFNLKDTVSKSEAENLNLFYHLGKTMVNYLAMRPQWLQQGQLSINQITHLSHDLKNGSVKDEEAVEYINTEKKEAEKIIEELNTNTDIIRRTMEQYLQALPTVEMVVKRINNNTLPELKNPAVKLKPKKH